MLLPGRRRAAFTLLELLVVAALLALLLALAAGLTPTLLRLGRSDGDALLRLQRQRAAEEALRFELGQAGYGEASPSLQVTALPAGAGPAGVALAFAYRVDRWRAAPQRRTVRLAAGRDARGDRSLYRAEGAAPRQPVVAGVAAVRLVAVATGSGWRAPPAPGRAVAGVVAVGIEIDFVWGATVRTVVPLRTPQSVTVTG